MQYLTVEGQCSYCLSPLGSFAFGGGKRSFAFRDPQRPVCKRCWEERGYLGDCCLCYEPICLEDSVMTCFGLLLCSSCAWSSKWKRIANKYRATPANLNVGKQNRQYKRFLAGKAYPEVKVWHKCSADSCETTSPIKDNEFFKGI